MKVRIADVGIDTYNDVITSRCRSDVAGEFETTDAAADVIGDAATRHFDKWRFH